MTRRQVVISLEAGLLERAEATAAESGKPLEAVVERALVRYLGLEALERMQATFDLDPDEADRVAHEEQRAFRAGR